MDPSSIQLCRSLCCASQVLSPFKVHFLVVGLVRLSLQDIDYDSKTLATANTVGSTVWVPIIAQVCYLLSLRELHWWQDLTTNSRSNFLQILIRFFNIYCDCYVWTSLWQSIVCMDYGHPMKLFFIKIPIWADRFWRIWGIFEQFISTHFGTVSPLSMFSIKQQLFLQENQPLYPNPKYLFGIGI